MQIMLMYTYVEIKNSLQNIPGYLFFLLILSFCGDRYWCKMRSCLLQFITCKKNQELPVYENNTTCLRSWCIFIKLPGSLRGPIAIGLHPVASSVH